MRDLFDFHYRVTKDEKYNVSDSITPEYIEKTLGKLEYYVSGDSFIRGEESLILDLWVPEQDRSQGIATALVARFGEGKGPLHVQVDPRNGLAMAFWNSFPDIAIIEN